MYNNDRKTPKVCIVNTIFLLVGLKPQFKLKSPQAIKMKKSMAYPHPMKNVGNSRRPQHQLHAWTRGLVFNSSTRPYGKTCEVGEDLFWGHI